MFSKFLDFFNINLELENTVENYESFITKLGGLQFGNGLFNTFSKQNIKKWTEIVTEAYPEFSDKFSLFGYDWQGNCFGIDLRSNTRGKIVLFEIAADEVLEIPVSFIEFLNIEIPSNPDACLLKSYFDEWVNSSNTAIKDGECVGYKIPLFLGGEDSISNLEIGDMEVYWHILSQIKNQI